MWLYFKNNISKKIKLFVFRKEDIYGIIIFFMDVFFKPSACYEIVKHIDWKYFDKFGNGFKWNSRWRTTIFYL